MIGRSGSPPMKSTITSWPTRGRLVPPKPLPPQGWLEWIQHEEDSFIFDSRSQGQGTRARANSFGWNFSAAGPTTVALSTPLVFGFGVAWAGRYEDSALTASH